MNNEALQITLPGEVRYLPALLKFVRELGKTRGLGDEKLQHLELATEEAVVNALKYAPSEGGEPLKLTCREIANGMQVTVQDKGEPALIDFEQLDKLNLEEDERFEQAGLLVLSGLTDYVECRNCGTGGREMCIEVHFDDNSIAEETEDGTDIVEGFPASGRDETDYHRDADDVSVRLMEPGDAISVSRCIYGSYGYTYKEDFYYPDRLIRQHEAGKICCAVAEFPDGEVAGTASIGRESAVGGLFELCALATRNKYRGMGVAKRLSDFLIQHEKRNDETMDSLFMESVTNHPYSQKIAHDYGFHTTGFFFGLVPRNVDFHGIEKAQNPEMLPERISTVFNVLCISERQQQTLYVPTRHHDIVGDIYDQYDFPVNLSDSGKEAQPGTNTALNTIFLEGLKVGILSVESLGSDFTALVQSRTYELKARGAEVIILYLNMLDEATARAVEWLETMGFLFTGVLPGNEGFHPILMQYFAGVTFDTRHIEVTDAVGQRLLDYARSGDKTLSFE